MSLRARLTLVAAGVVAVVVVLASATTYFVMRHELQAQLDGSLRSTAHTVQLEGHIGGPGDYGGNLVEVVDPDGNLLAASQGLNLRATDDPRVLHVAGSKDMRSGFYRDIAATYHGPGKPPVPVRLREYVAPIGFPSLGAVLVVKSLQQTDRALDRLRLILILVSLGAIALAAVGGALVSGATLAPVRRLTAAAERIAETGEPSERVPEGGHDELAALGASFNTMLAALEESLETQRRFVADASHELRTPLTSLQTNIDVLRGDIELDPDQRRRLLDDLHRESQEMRGLIAGLLELARGGGAQVEKEKFQLDELVEDTVERARNRFPAVEWEATGSSRPSSTATATGWSAPSGTCSRTPASGAATAARSRSRSRAASCWCATTGRDSRTRTGPSSSTASTARPRRGRCPAPVSGWRSSARWPRRTAARSLPRMPGTAGAIVRLSLNGAAGPGSA